MDSATFSHHDWSLFTFGPLQTVNSDLLWQGDSSSGDVIDFPRDSTDFDWFARFFSGCVSFTRELFPPGVVALYRKACRENWLRVNALRVFFYVWYLQS